MRLTAAEQLALGVIDEVVPEPEGGAHTNPEETARRLRARIAAQLDTLAGRDRKMLLDARYARYRNMGEFASRPRRHRPARALGHCVAHPPVADAVARRWLARYSPTDADADATRGCRR
jgi:enoyl-CoA hydratase/carnithine racemase